MIHIIMPMAGDGVRFKKAGYSEIKPTLNVKGRPMFTYPLSSIPLDNFDYQLHFVLKSQDDHEACFSSILKKYHPNAVITLLPEATQGPLETISTIIEKLPDEDAALILDCDLIFKCSGFNQYLISHHYSHSSLLYFYSQRPHFSYAKINGNGQVLQTAEKEIISSNALAGVYFFHRIQILKIAMRNVSPGPYQFYIAPLFNHIIKQKHCVFAYPLEQYHSLGTPKELNLYLSKISL